MNSPFFNINPTIKNLTPAIKIFKPKSSVATSMTLYVVLIRGIADPHRAMAKMERTIADFLFLKNFSIKASYHKDRYYY